MTFSLAIKTAEQRHAEARAARSSQVIAAVDAHVEDRAKALGYNSAAHCASYVASTVPEWSAEAQAFVAWRDRVWQTAHEAMAGDVAQPDAIVAGILRETVA